MLKLALNITKYNAADFVLTPVPPAFRFGCLIKMCFLLQSGCVTRFCGLSVQDNVSFFVKQTNFVLLFHL